jgi:hypothetical protein
VVPGSRSYPGTFLEELRETMKHLRIDRILTQIRTVHLANKTAESYRYNNLLGGIL